VLTAKEANRRYFRQAYLSGKHGWASDRPSPYAVSFLRQLRRLIKGGRLLDLGCGEGRHGIAAARLGFEVTAVDYEPLALKRARAFAKAAGLRGITFRRANALGLPFPESTFGVVLDYGCFHHQKKEDWAAYLAGVLRVLKPQGFLVLSVFSPRFCLFRGSRRPWHIAQGAYRRFFTSKDLRAIFGRDFRILKLVEEKANQGGFWHVLMRRHLRLGGPDRRPRREVMSMSELKDDARKGNAAVATLHPKECTGTT
jgi:SAM-dependent methyltransferase